MITLNDTHKQTQIVTNTTASTYQTVLTIGSSFDIVGIYNCTVQNARGSDSTQVIIPDNGELILYMPRGILMILYHLLTSVHVE